MVTVLACKEAVFKAFSPAPEAHALSLTMHGGGLAGWAALEGIDPVLVAASWEVMGGIHPESRGGLSERWRTQASMGVASGLRRDTRGCQV